MISFFKRIINRTKNRKRASIELDKSKKEIQRRFSDSVFPLDVLYDNKTVVEGKAIIRNQSDISSSHIGFGSLVGFNSRLPNSKIGRFCSIANNVDICAATHPTHFVSTNVSFYNTLNDNIPFGKSKAKTQEILTTPDGYYVEIGNDVWIGQDVLLKGGIKIGDGAIIGMRAVVTKDVPPYAIVGGVPAKVIKYRFDEDTIRSLLKIKWWDWSIEEIDNHREEFCNVEEFIKKHIEK